MIAIETPAEREEIDFLRAAGLIIVVEQCSTCHCECERTVSGTCQKCLDDFASRLPVGAGS